MTSTYNEPLITSEWAVAVFREAKAAGLVCSYVSNGNGTPEVLDYIRPWVSLYKVDLKSFRDRHYRELGGTLERVLWTIRALHERGLLARDRDAASSPASTTRTRSCATSRAFLVSVSPDIPWHVTAFHKDYKMTDPDDTSVRDAPARGGDRRARGAALRLRGQPPGRASGRWENTYCPGCRALLDRARRLPHRCRIGSARRGVPGLRAARSRASGTSLQSTARSNA